MPLDTLANVKTALGVADAADDALLARLQASADSYIQAFCGRTFAGGTFTEQHPGGAKVLFLRNYPVAAVVEVRVDAALEFAADTVLPPAGYTLHPDRGVLASRDGSFVPALPGWDIGPEHFPNAVRVTYTAAAEGVPAAVCQAYAQLVGHWYRQAKTHAETGQLNVLQQPTPAGNVVYPWGQCTGFKLPGGVLDLLKPFRVPAM
jgi:uncharacterized phiE125 gp8 family phage protein